MTGLGLKLFAGSNFLRRFLLDVAEEAGDFVAIFAAGGVFAGLFGVHAGFVALLDFDQAVSQSISDCVSVFGS